jgi:hypothetical protein
VFDHASGLAEDLQEALPALTRARKQPNRVRLLLLDRSKHGWYDLLKPADSRSYLVETLFAPGDPEEVHAIRDVETGGNCSLWV